MSLSWSNVLKEEKKKPYFLDLMGFLEKKESAGKVIYPPNDQIFTAFSLTPLSKVKVVVLGQDPYHGPDQANGLAFSVPKGIKAPPSLVNIFKELKSDIGIDTPSHGNLEKWAEQGVLLLNSVMTVEEQQAASHAGKGWEIFTDFVIDVLDREKEGLVFLLWGAYAQRKGSQIDRSKHLVLEAPHPSPLSAYRGFLGCKHFSKVNEWLTEKGTEIIDWEI